MGTLSRLPSRKCSATRADGQPCRAWAVHDTEPPLCSAHAGRNVGAGAPSGNQNAVTHGFYARALTPADLRDLLTHAGDLTIDDEIGMARIALRRVIRALRGTNGDDLTPEQLARLVQLAFSGTRTIGRLLRDRRALVDHPAGDFMGIIGQALDQLSETWDLDL